MLWKIVWINPKTGKTESTEKMVKRRIHEVLDYLELHNPKIKFSVVEVKFQ